MSKLHIYIYTLLIVRTGMVRFSEYIYLELDWFYLKKSLKSSQKNVNVKSNENRW